MTTSIEDNTDNADIQIMALPLLVNLISHLKSVNASENHLSIRVQEL